MGQFRVGTTREKNRNNGGVVMIERKWKGNYVSRGQNELIGGFKLAADGAM